MPDMDAHAQGVKRVVAPAPPEDVLRFKAMGLNICVPLKYVEKVLPLMELMPVPDGPDYVKGVMNLHGRSIVVMDIAERVGVERTAPYTVDTPILLCTRGLVSVGFLIDEIRGVSRLEVSDVQISSVFKDGGHLFTAVVNTGADQSLMLDVESILV